MADKVIQFPGIRSWNIKKIEELIDAKLSHDNPQVLSCLKEEVKGLVQKYYDEKEIVFQIPLPAGLTEEQARTIEESFHQAFTDYHEELRRQAHAIFLDLCLSKLENCELKYSSAKKPDQQT